ETAQIHGQAAGREVGHLLARRALIDPSRHKRRILTRNAPAPGQAAGSCPEMAARTRSTTRSRSSNVRPVVGSEGRNVTSTVVGQMSALPFLMACRPPVTATGTMGACAFRAMTNPPFLNGRSSPVRLRVPSGKMKNEYP